MYQRTGKTLPPRHEEANAESAKHCFFARCFNALIAIASIYALDLASRRRVFIA